MERNDPRYQAYVEILKEELIPAMGCTEPIALAYAAAKAREVLGVLPDSVQLQVSGSIIKNVKSVIVPNTGHLKGMERRWRQASCWFRREGAGGHLGGQRGKEVCHPGLSADGAHHHRAHRAGACV
mgnify:CR=1 FL=1